MTAPFAAGRERENDDKKSERLGATGEKTSGNPEARPRSIAPRGKKRETRFSVSAGAAGSQHEHDLRFVHADPRRARSIFAD